MSTGTSSDLDCSEQPKSDEILGHCMTLGAKVLVRANIVLVHARIEHILNNT